MVFLGKVGGRILLISSAITLSFMLQVWTMVTFASLGRVILSGSRKASSSVLDTVQKFSIPDEHIVWVEFLANDKVFASMFYLSVAYILLYVAMYPFKAFYRKVFGQKSYGAK